MRSSEAHKTTSGRIPILEMISKEASLALFKGPSRISAQGARWREMFADTSVWKEFTSTFHYRRVPTYDNLKLSAKLAANDISRRMVDFARKSKYAGLLRVSPCYSYIHDEDSPASAIGYQVSFFVYVPPLPKALPTPKAHTPRSGGRFVGPFGAPYVAKAKAKTRIRHRGKFVYLVDWR